MIHRNERAMRARRKLWLRIIMCCTLVFACAAAADFIGFSALGRGAELRSYDLCFKIRGPLPVSPRAPVSILAIDEESLSRIPNPLILWQHEYARIIDNLAAQGAGVVGIDFIFSDVSRFDPEGQRELGRAVLQAGVAGVPASLVVRELNEYLTEMVAVIQKHNGMVDKFLGDGIMAIFGTPVEDPDAAFNGVRAALGMMAALRGLNDRFVKRGVQPLSIGIGIHRGEAVVGNIGSPQKMEYTAIGDAVNVASRIEGSLERSRPRC